MESILLYLSYLFPVMTAQQECSQCPYLEEIPPGVYTSLPILFISSYDSTTGVFTVPPGGDGVYTSLPILFISRYDSTTGVFTVPPWYGTTDAPWEMESTLLYLSYLFPDMTAQQECSQCPLEEMESILEMTYLYFSTYLIYFQI